MTVSEFSEWTEREWQACTNPSNLAEYMIGAATQRRLRLAAVALGRLSASLLANKKCRQALDVAERYADGTANKEELLAARSACEKARANLDERTSEKARGRAIHAAEAVCTTSMDWSTFHFLAERIAAKQVDPCDVLRDVFGNPFRSVTFRREWRTPSVLSVARVIYAERRFEDLPILADALEDAGCTLPELLAHCRNPGEHARGCWALDLCLGVEELTEEQWLAGEDVGELLPLMHLRVSDRKLRLFAIACCRRIWDGKDEFDGQIIEEVERYVEGEREGLLSLDNTDTRACGDALAEAFGWASMVSSRAVGVADETACRISYGLGEQAYYDTMNVDDWEKVAQPERVAQAHLLRCIVGNPFRPVRTRKKWKSPRVVNLAKAIYDTHAFKRMSELARLLERTGCADPDVLGHSRGPAVHARGCWVIDLLLGKK